VPACVCVSLSLSLTRPATFLHVRNLHARAAPALPSFISPTMLITFDLFALPDAFAAPDDEIISHQGWLASRAVLTSCLLSSCDVLRRPNISRRMCPSPSSDSTASLLCAFSSHGMEGSLLLCSPLCTHD